MFVLGIREPMLISSPIHERKNEVSYSMTSLLDIVPTVLDWFNISHIHQEERDKLSPLKLTGKSLIPLLTKGINENEEYQSNLNFKYLFLNVSNFFW